MLTLLTPFILGIVVQVSAIFNAELVAPVDDNKISSEISRDEFAYRLDCAVLAPSVVILASAALLNRGRLSEEVTMLIVAIAVMVLLAGFVALRRATPSSYAIYTSRLASVTPLNVGVIVANVALGVLTLCTASPEEETRGEPGHSAASRPWTTPSNGKAVGAFTPYL